MGDVAAMCLTACLAAMLLSPSLACSGSSWRDTFSSTGLSKCTGSMDFINGFYRHSFNGDPDHLNKIAEAWCCPRPSPWTTSGNLVVHADWWNTLDSNFRWGRCPNGYFLNGLYRNENTKGWLSNIEEGRCVRPSNAPAYYGDCYDHDTSVCFANRGWCRCNDGYFVTGVYRGGCNSLYCLTKVRCCKPAPAEETLNELFKVKTYVMDVSLRDMAYLAAYLGYKHNSGCRSGYVGDDFVRSGDSWIPDMSRRCTGTRPTERLNIRYTDWSFGIKEIAYGQRVIEDIEPETVDAGIVHNNADTPASKTISRRQRAVRSVTHTKTSDWKVSVELGIEISYSPPPTGGFGGSASFTFGYETGSTTTDSTNSQQWNIFEVSSSKELAPFSSVRWQLVMAKTRNTLPYTAKILVRFATEFRGFLRRGGGPSSIYTNYHYQYKGSDARPTFNYKFGNAGTPFYTDLERKSTTGSRPWLWFDLKSARPAVNNHIDRLTNEDRYSLILTGKFEDVIGKEVELTWDDVPAALLSRTDNSTAIGNQTSKIATTLPPATNLPPPNFYKPGDEKTTVTEFEEDPNDI